MIKKAPLVGFAGGFVENRDRPFKISSEASLSSSTWTQNDFDEISCGAI